MTQIEQLFEIPPYSVKKVEKQALLVDQLNVLSSHHVSHCEPYRKIRRASNNENQTFSRVDEFPYLPVRLFKEFDLKSIPDSDVIKTLTSSGTTGSQVSKIFLDKETSRFQTKALSCIVQDFIGKKRLPMLIIDSAKVIKDRRLFSARGAGILGMANFGYDHLYVLDTDMRLDLNLLKVFLEKHKDETILLFGFTFMIWQHFYREIAHSKTPIDLSHGILIHSGGWKKLADEAVDPRTFGAKLKEACSLERVHNFYGMVEQVGSVYMECEQGHLHAPVFSDIVIRDPRNWSAVEIGQHGVIEVLSVLPHSYPGHVLLTEDMGEVLGEDDCPCGRQGKYFRVTGRIPKAEIRGCSDTYES